MQQKKWSKNDQIFTIEEISYAKILNKTIVKKQWDALNAELDKSNDADKAPISKKEDKDLSKAIDEARIVGFKNSDICFDLLISTMKKVEEIDEITFVEYVKQYPNDKGANPFARLIDVYKSAIKHLEAKYIKYLKDNKIKAPKGIEVDKGACKIQPLEQTRKFK